MRLLVVIVNYRTAPLVIDCLASLEPQIRSIAGAHVTVVDNASADGSAESLASAITDRGWSDWATLVRADRNGGFAYGNNIAIRAALRSSDPPDYVMLLNSDTLVLDPAIQSLIDFLEAHPKAAVVGSHLE